MKLTLSLLALVGNAAAAPKRERLVASDYSFDEYQKDFRRKYASAEETIMREKIFRETQKRVITHNARGTSWRESLNEFSDRTVRTGQCMKGVVLLAN